LAVNDSAKHELQNNRLGDFAAAAEGSEKIFTLKTNSQSEPPQTRRENKNG